MAEGPKMFSKPAALAKKVPKWAYYVSGGVLVAGGIMYVRNRQNVSQPTPGANTAATDGVVGYTDPQGVSSPIVPRDIGSQAVPAEINTDIPSATLSVFTDLFGSFSQTLRDQGDLITVLAKGGPSSNQNGASQTGGVVTKPVTPKTPKTPKGNPLAKLDPGYHGGSHVNMGASAQRTFPGAVGWTRIGDGGKGPDHWVDIHVRFCNKLERWRVYPNRKGNPWTRTWGAGRPEICK